MATTALLSSLKGRGEAGIGGVASRQGGSILSVEEPIRSWREEVGSGGSDWDTKALKNKQTNLHLICLVCECVCATAHK